MISLENRRNLSIMYVLMLEQKLKIKATHLYMLFFSPLFFSCKRWHWWRQETSKQAMNIEMIRSVKHIFYHIIFMIWYHYQYIQSREIARSSMQWLFPSLVYFVSRIQHRPQLTSGGQAPLIRQKAGLSMSHFRFLILITWFFFLLTYDLYYWHWTSHISNPSKAAAKL